MASGRLGEEPMRAGAGDARRVRPLLPRRRPRGRRRSTRSPPARSATRRTRRASWRARARALRARRSASSAARPRPATATWRRSTRRRSPTAACSTSAAARCSSCGSRDRLALRVGLVAAGHGADERALPAAQRARQAQAARGAARARRRRARRRRVARSLRRKQGGVRLVGIGGTVRNLAAAAQRAAGPAHQRGAGDGDRAATRSTSWSSGSPRCPRPSAPACRASSPPAPT